MREEPVNVASGDALPGALSNEWRGRGDRAGAAARRQATDDGARALEPPPRRDAERRARARDEVIAVVAHDLRSPIHTIAAAAALLGLTSDDDRHRRQIAIIQRSARNMERLTAQLLDAARIEAEALQLHLAPIDLAALIAEAVEQCDSLARERGITVRCEIGGDIPQVAGDHDRLMQVLSNLLGNALKFTHQGRGISVRVARLGAMVQISVEDSGVGIAPEDLPHIFTRFWQVNRKSRTGVGLGLAICKGIVEAHGGRLRATSVVGRGTTMCFTLRAIPDDVAGETGGA